jgi:DNA-binding Lrp family transcriptional regulator
MVKAFVLIKVEPGRVKDVVEGLSNLNAVREVYCLSGPDDIIARLESDDAKSISEVVIAGLHNLEGIRGTDTRMVLELP